MRVDVKMIIVLIAIILLATMGSAYVTSWVFSGRSPGLAQTASAPRTVREEFNPDLVWDAGTFTVNLASGGRVTSFIKTGMSFRTNSKDTVNRLERQELQIRDRIITALLTTSSQELANEAGILTLKERIKDVVNEIIVDDGGKVEDVYFSEFVVQY